ncbi:MAG: class I SAM-dependent methyltransferase [Candidatus Neomarinimicrobiota bacterium]
MRLTSAKQTNNISGNLGYISAEETVKNAQKEDLSVCDYVEKMWDQIGETQKVIDNMEKYGAFNKTNPIVCEIGAGTGRYMEKVIAKCNPKRYESYEAAKDWADWLQNKYQIISQPTNGMSLKSTADNSIELVHSHGVFVYLPFFDSLRYFKEIDRVSSTNAFIVFDCITEDCLDEGSLNKWLKSKYNFPRIMPEKYIFEFFPSITYSLIGNFFTPYGQGKSKYFVFKRTKTNN